ncbi:hypothetical protein ElyMa_005535700 [Elysia marginata]|uniref:Uncharacterized protein n=1 Tax=Elysia marginata TaxID=1093978 RepID=A0AAV4EZN9_9GAST|nr:hypothetical protein ElyMa_005535700 [Elysia marginata]
MLTAISSRQNIEWWQTALPWSIIGSLQGGAWRSLEKNELALRCLEVLFTLFILLNLAPLAGEKGKHLSRGATSGVRRRRWSGRGVAPGLNLGRGATFCRSFINFVRYS